MTKRFAALAAPILAIILAASCSSGFIGQRSGTIVIATGAAPSARALTSGWPMGDDTLPEFSMLVVVVRGAGMDTVVANIDLTADASPIELQVKAGLQRSVYVAAFPDWTATALKYPDADLPTLAASFSGGTVVDIPADSVVPVTVELAMASSKILIPFFDPSANNPVLYIADSLGDMTLESYPVVQLYSGSNYVFGDHGRMFVSTGMGINAYSSPSSTPIETITTIQNNITMALCNATNRLYGYYDSDGVSLWYVDLDDETRTQYSVTDPVGFSFYEGGIAVDGLGRVYVPAFDDTASTYVIVQLDIEDPVSTVSASSVSASTSLEDLGLGFWSAPPEPMFSQITIEDLTVAGGVLYIAASEIYAYSGIYESDVRSRGKLVAVSTSTLQQIGSTGWSVIEEIDPETGDPVSFETNLPSDPTTQFYGPRRFVAVSPRKLYLLDSGCALEGDPLGFVNVNRVVEVDMNGLIITATGLDGAAPYFDTDYSEYSLYMPVC